MVKASTVRAEIARINLRQNDIATALSIPTDVLSQLLNERRERPEVLERIWDYVQGRKQALEK
jgi:plasmid maintenance system antidote protein VapI